MPTREERLSEAIARQADDLANVPSPLTSVGGSPAARVDVSTPQGAGGVPLPHQPEDLNPNDPFDRGMISIHPTTRSTMGSPRPWASASTRHS